MGKWILVLGLMFSVFSVSTAGQAAAKETVINKQMVTTASLNVRSTNSTSGKVIGWLKSNTKFKAIAKTSNNWYRFSLKGKMATYLGNTSRPQLPRRHQNLQRQKLCK